MKIALMFRKAHAKTFPKTYILLPCDKLFLSYGTLLVNFRTVSYLTLINVSYDFLSNYAETKEIIYESVNSRGAVYDQLHRVDGP